MATKGSTNTNNKSKRPVSATVGTPKTPKSVATTIMAQQHSSIPDDDDACMMINIGGQLFTTTKRTLSSPVNDEMHFFCVLCSGNFKISTDDHGRVFVNRDATHFRYILNYLRVEGNFEKTSFPWHDEQAIEELILESEFYNLTHLTQFLQGDTFWYHVRQAHAKRCFAAIGDLGFSNNQMTFAITKPYQTVTIRSIAPLFVCHNAQQLPRKNLRDRLQRLNFFEMRIDCDSSDCMYMGMMPIVLAEDEKNLVHKCKHGYAISNRGSKIVAGNSSNYGECWKDGDHIGMWFDAVHWKIYFYKNGKSMGCAFALTEDVLLEIAADKWFVVVSFENRTDKPGVSLTASTYRPD